MKRYIDSDGIERVVESWWSLTITAALIILALVAMLAMGAIYQ